MAVSEENTASAYGLGNRRSIQLSYGAERKNRQKPISIDRSSPQRAHNSEGPFLAENVQRDGEKSQDQALGNGNVRAAEIMRRVWSHVDRRGEDQCWPWLGTVDRDGYGRTEISGKKHQTHKLVLEEKLGRKLDAGEVTRHSCNNPACNNPNHLSPGTQARNLADRDAANRQAKGESNGRAKLTAEKVLEARKRVGAGESYVRVAIHFGVDPTTLRNAMIGKTWSNLPSVEAVEGGAP